MVHLDGLGIVCADTSGRQIYQPRPTDAGGRLEQLFHRNAMPEEAWAAAKSSAPVAHSALVFYPNQTIEETRSAARHCTVDRADDDGLEVTVGLEDGMRVRFDLRDLSVVPVTPEEGAESF